MLNRRNKYLSVTNLAGPRAIHDRVDNLVYSIVCRSNFELYLRGKIHDVFCSPIKLNSALLPTIASDFGDSNTDHVSISKRLTHVV